MKRDKIYYLLVAVIAVVGLTGCSKSNKNHVVEGLPTSMKVTIAQPNVYSAREARDGNAILNETIFNTVDVYIYNVNTNALDTYVRLDGATDFTPEEVGNGVYVGTRTIATTTGPKRVYVGVNLSLTLANQIKQSGPTTIKSINTLQDIIDGGTNTGFAMFSVTPTVSTLTADPENASNKLSVNVKRLVAKATLQAGSSLDLNISGGTLSQLRYNSFNINKRFFPLPFDDAGVIKDPNWESQGSGVIQLADLYNSLDADYININTSAISDNKLLVPKYFLENNSEGTYADELSYVALRASFVPSQILVYTNGTDVSGGINSTANPNPISTFYRLRMTNGEIFYVSDVDVAIDYATVTDPDPGHQIDIYESGHCYYKVYLNKDKQFSIYRNDFYKITITAINGLGSSTPVDIGHLPLEEPTNIVVNITVVDWNLIDYDTQLPGGRR